jgi:hypothetical protein
MERVVGKSSGGGVRLVGGWTGSVLTSHEDGHGPLT